MTCVEECIVMNRDTEELPAIMLEMEVDMKAIEGHQCVFTSFFWLLKIENLNSEKATRTKENLEKDLEHLAGVLDKLDELGEIMEEMLQTQDSVQVRFIIRFFLTFECHI